MAENTGGCPLDMFTTQIVIVGLPNLALSFVGLDKETQYRPQFR